MRVMIPTFLASARERNGDEVASPAVDVVLKRFPTPDYVVVRSVGELGQHLPRLLGQPWLGLDTETSGLDATSDKLRLVQLAPVDGSAVVVDVRTLDPLALAPLFGRRGPKLIGHNLSFDLRFLGTVGLGCPPAERLFDTELVARLLGASGAPAPEGTYGLRSLVRRILGVELPKDQQTTFAARELSTDQLDYAARDAAAPLALAPLLNDQLTAAGLREAAVIELCCLPFMVWLDESGVALDADMWAELAHAALADKYRLELRLTELGRTGGIPGQLGDFRFSLVNWSAHAQVLKLLQHRGLDLQDANGKLSTDSHVLAGFLEDDPIVGVLLDHREADTRANRYGLDSLAKFLRADGRLHPDYHQLGTAVGRMSCTDPPVQGTPRGPKYRSAFHAPEGYVLVKADYNQIDLRVAAEWAPDDTLIRAYQEGADVHRLTASRVRGVDPSAVSSEDRQAAKATNFGFAYGMGIARLIDQARAEHGVTFTRAQAQQFRSGFFSLYRGIKAWHDRYCEPYGAETPIDIRVPSGRRRTGVRRFTEKLASSIQMQVSDGFKRGLAGLWRTREQLPSARPVLLVHDEVVVEVEQDAAEDAAEWLRAEMTAGMQHVLGRVPVVVETTVARDWGGTPLEAPICSLKGPVGVLVVVGIGTLLQRYVLPLT
jgi:DNA polymerase-1